MPESQPKRNFPSSISPSPRSGGHVDKRSRLNDAVIDLTGDSEDDKVGVAPVALRQHPSRALALRPPPFPLSVWPPPAQNLQPPVAEVEEEPHGPNAQDRLRVPAHQTAQPPPEPHIPARIRTPSPPPQAIEIVDLTNDSDAEQRRRSPRSPTPSFDYRITLWAQETRQFEGKLIMDEPEQARLAAEEACRCPLWLNDNDNNNNNHSIPRIIIFCDGSSNQKAGMKRKGTKGGYGVVFRNPWTSEEDRGRRRRQQQGRARARAAGFEVRSWSFEKMFSSGQAELAAIAQSIDTALRLREKHPGAAKFEVRIFTDSQECWHRLDRGLNQNPGRFSFRHTEPILRAAIWLSHRLKIMGGELEVRWNPRRCADGARLADDAAGVHSRGVDPGAFNERHVRLFERDGILSMVHEEISAVVRERANPPPVVPLPDWF
ncbi:hypothetical protein B0T20DRAFT_276172 [Sordaria brevicollis]|uniref:RNase H type-1 domain-containing protein n=1 Tax=Sordaria brevicollis TaxID=83679 RepID=A0AAE0PB44_SORBR|nr:hypothetical protein B0T20DRAFT_276172 [Sordaria brevicollis]